MPHQKNLSTLLIRNGRTQSFTTKNALLDYWAEHLGRDISFNFENHDQAFASVGNTLSIGRVTLMEASADHAVSTYRAANHVVTQLFVGEGGLSLNGQPLSSERQSMLAVHDRSHVTASPAGTVNLGISIEHRHLETYLSDVMGGLDARLTFADTHVASTQMMSRIRHTFLRVVADWNAMGERLAPVALAELERAMMFDILLCNPHNHSHLLLAPGRDSSGKPVALIEAYLEANWKEPFAIEKLVQLTGVTPRSIFRQFRRGRNCSPYEFLRNVRLNKARDILLRGDPRLGVLDASIICGFANAGRMASWYVRAFGELPSETRRRSLGLRH